MVTATDEGVRLTLRPYQEDALARVDQAKARGVRRQLGVAATGLGKTVIFCALAARRQCRTLILVHRDELVTQTVAKVAEVWPGVTVGVVKGTRNEMRAQVVVASVQTLSRPNRLRDLPTVLWGEDAGALFTFVGEPFGLVVTDEAHHATAASYVTIYDHLGVGHEDGPDHLGVTATPDRGDGQGLDAIYDEVVFSYDILWGIRAGFLSDVRGQLVTVDGFDLGAVRTRQGDYDQGQAGRMMEAAGAPGTITAAVERYASDRKTLVFTPTVDMARVTHEAFAADGVPSAYVHGGTPLDERRAMLAAYHRGDLRVMVNCGVLTEGYDEPSIGCIVVARPTQSRALYTQIIGRGTRRHPDKADLLVLDVTGVSRTHSLVTIPSLFGIDKPERVQDGKALLSEVMETEEREAVAAGRLRAEDVELFTQVRSEGIAWVSAHKPGSTRRRYVRSLGQGPGGRPRPTVVLAQVGPDDWNAGLLLPDGTKRALIMHVSQEMAQGVGEDYVRKNTRPSTSGLLVSSGAPWRKKPPSVGAQGLAKRLGIPLTPGMTAGDLADKIDGAKAALRLRT